MQFTRRTRWLLAAATLLTGTAVVAVNVSAAAADDRRPVPILGAVIPALGLDAPPSARPLAAPVAHHDAYSTPAGVDLDVDTPGVLSNDTGFDPMKTVPVEQTPPQHGQQAGVDAERGGFTYTSDPGFTGSDSFSYCIVAIGTDDGCLSNVATVTITVTAPGAPVAHDDGAPTHADTPVHITAPGVLANDTAFDPSIHTIKVASAAQHGVRDLKTDGAYDYTPDPGFTGSDSFTYCIAAQADPFTCASNIATVTIEVAPVQSVANDDHYTTAAGLQLHVDPPGVLANDTGLSPTGKAARTSFPSHGDEGCCPNGGFNYTPDLGFTGTDSFTYCIVDGVLDTDPCVSNSATITITVTPPPVAHDDAYTTPAGVQLSVDAPGVLANDESDNDPLGDPFYVEGRSTPAHGNLDLGSDGHLIYSPAAGFGGTDSFTYCLNSSHLPKTNCESNVATVTITVSKPPPPSTSGPSGPQTPPRGDSDPGAPASGSLPRTGADLWWPLGVGSLLLGLGVAITVVGARRRRAS